MSRSLRGPHAAALIFVAGQLSGLGGSAPSPSAAVPFSFESVRQRAAALAAAPYRPEPNPMPEKLKRLSYGDYQAIHFRPEKGPWQADRLHFTFQFFHPGSLFQDGVLIHLVESGQVKDFEFSPEQFDYGPNHLPGPLPAGLRFAGLRILYPVNSPQSQDEVASFLGASYFRLLGKGQRYGISARAVAIDTGEPTGEEFPRFTEFWIERPPRRSNSLALFALLDSPSVAGAYRFALKPGAVTVLEEEAWLFLRKDVKKLGLAPLTSMFLVGANRTRYVPDFRPEIHDSDGLLLATGERGWEWRPLVNPEKAHHLSSFATESLKGFGLFQRQRDFHAYEDLVARYELRPNLWVQPQGSWGAGVVELVEIPTPSEYNDNIVAYWIPKQKMSAGQQLHWSCLLRASLGEPEEASLLRVESTRIDPPRDKKPLRFVLDFNGPKAASHSAQQSVAAKVKASRGEVRHLTVHRNEVTGGWRAFFDLLLAGDESTQLRLFLVSGDKVLSETWVYDWNP